MTDRLSSCAAASLLLPATALLTVFLAIPAAYLFVDSFRPFDPFLGTIPDAWTTQNFTSIVTDSFIGEVLLRTIKISALTALFSVLVGYPVAYYFVFHAKRSRALILFCVLSPLLISALVRTYGWLILLGRDGPVEHILVFAGLMSPGARLLQTDFSVILGMTHLFLAFVFLSLVAALNNIDGNVSRAARILGAGPIRSFLHVTLPMSMNGVISGAILVFTLSTGAFITPVILGGSRVRVMSYAIWEQFSVLNNYPAGAVLALMLTVVVVIVVYASARLSKPTGER
ncbi:MAG: ABC transporter permease [Planctomycetaceae bacterium]